MRLVSLFVFILVMGLFAEAQNEISYPELDKSPLDVSYYPTQTTFRNFQKGEGRTIQPKARVIYSRPQKKGRSVIGGLIPEGEIWRLGANEATELTLYEDANIGGKSIKKGTYSMFAKVEDGQWNLILSQELFIWGAYNLDESKFLEPIALSTEENDQSLEALTILFEDSEDSHLIIAWDTLKASVKISF